MKFRSSSPHISSACVIGYGRFGQLLTDLLARSVARVAVIESDDEKASLARAHGRSVVTGEELATYEFIFLCTPISTIADMLRQIVPHLTAAQVVVDVCSVKTYPLQQMERFLSGFEYIGTHPMFGPDSAKVGLKGSRLALCPGTASADHVEALARFWQQHGIVVIETTPDAHDLDAVYSQAFAYTIAKLVIEMRPSHEIAFRTRSYDWLSEIARLSSNDTEQLFHDIITYNPYVADMIRQFKSSARGVEQRIEEILAEQQASRLFEG